MRMNDISEKKRPIEVTADDLKKVLKWGTQQRTKIDRFLKKNMFNIWPSTNKKTDVFFEELLTLVVKKQQGERLVLALEQLDNQQPPHKKRIFSIIGRFTAQIFNAVNKIDPTINDEFDKDEEITLFSRMSNMVILLEDNGQPEYQRVFDHFIRSVIEEEDYEEDYEEECDGESFPEAWLLKSELESLCNKVSEMVHNLAFGICIDEKKVANQIKRIKSKGIELKKSIVEAADRAEFTDELWGDEKSFNTFCCKLSCKIEKQNSNNAKRIKFFDELICIIEGIDIVHRSSRKQKSLKKSLAEIGDELRAKTKSDNPIFPSDLEVADDWLSWAFHLEGDELDSLQEELENDYPALADFIGECQWDWLRFDRECEIAEEAIPEPSHLPSVEYNVEADVVCPGDKPLEDVTEIEEDCPEILSSPAMSKIKNVEGGVSTPREPDVDIVNENINEVEETSGNECDEDRPVEDICCGVENASENSVENETEHLPPAMEPIEDGSLYKYLKNGEFAKAYWIATSCKTTISADLIGAFALGSQIGVGSALPADLQSFLGKLVTEDFSDLHSKLFLLGVISGVALFVEPASGDISTLITFIDTGIESVDKLVKFINSELVYKGTTIRPDDVNCVIGSEEKEQRMNALKDRSVELKHRVRNTVLSYEPANGFLRHLYSEGGDLALIHRVIERNLVSKKSDVHALIKKCTGEALVSDAHKLGLKKIAIPFTGKVRNQLTRRINETISLGREWYNLVSERAAKDDKLQKERNLIQLRSLLKKTIQHLNEMSGSNFETIAAKAVSISFENLIDKLDGAENPNVIPLNTEIITASEIVLDDNFEVQDGYESCLIEYFSKQEEKRTISEEEVKEIIQRKEFLRASHLISTVVPLSNLEPYLENEIEKIIQKELDHITFLNDRVEDAYLLGQLAVIDDMEPSEHSADTIRSEFISKLVNAQTQLKSSNKAVAWRIRDILTAINEIEHRLDDMADNSHIQTQKEFLNILEEFPDSEVGREDKEYIQAAFQEANVQGDSIAALELLNRAKESIQLKSPVPRASMGSNPELLKFVEQLDVYQELLGRKTKIRSYISQISNRKNIEGIKINFGEFDTAHIEKIVSGISAWNKLLTLNYSKSEQMVLDSIANVTDYLDLKVKKDKIAFKTPIHDDFLWISVELNFPIDCSPVPAFGSAMGNHAQIVISRNKKEADQLYSFLSRHELQYKPVFLFYLHEMSIRQRQKYQRFFFKKKASVLIVDLCLLFHLSRVRNRLPMLFNTTLPFCFVQPYMMKGPNVPNEIFVGRSYEVQSILDQDGSCIVYGGRQLGKSALLRHVHKIYNKPSKNEFIVYIEIDNLGMAPQSHENMVEEFWKKVYRNLCRIGFVEEKVLRSKKTQTIENEVVDEILKALNSSSREQRLYLLLDETDHFLDNDSSLNFPIIRRLRGMVASSDSRFKVILAGLQSVQRYKNLKNHPFAQLGSDMVIKPLSPNAAQRLILRPLSALGFTFEKTGLILRILSQANYHPGLIQIFCHRLVEKLYKKWSNKTTPSSQIIRKIVLEDLQAIERDASFTEEIKERFDWTLDLDDRYKVLIYALVLTEDQTGSRAEREFMSIGREWWPQVFAKMDQQALRSVLDEMVGLGVLVREDAEFVRTYRLRSPNLLRLLGTREQIEDELERIISLDKPRILNSRNFHPKISNKPLRFGPLTTEQEGQIANCSAPFILTVINGSSALGLQCVREQIKKIFEKDMEDESWQELNPPADSTVNADNLIRFTKKKLKLRKRSHNYLVADLSLFPSDLKISDFFIKFLNECQRQVCTKTSRGYIFFIMDPERLWTWLGERERETLLSSKTFNSISLKRWSDGAITNALENIDGLTGGKAYGEDIFSITSGWHSLIQGGINNFTSKIDGKVNTVQLWENQVYELKQLIDSDPKEVLDRFGLRSSNDALNGVIKTLFEWSNTGDNISITQDSLDLWREEVADITEMVVNETRFKKWVQLLDIVYRNDEQLTVESLICMAVKAGILSQNN